MSMIQLYKCSLFLRNDPKCGRSCICSFNYHQIDLHFLRLFLLKIMQNIRHTCWFVLFTLNLTPISIKLSMCKVELRPMFFLIFAEILGKYVVSINKFGNFLPYLFVFILIDLWVIAQGTDRINISQQ